jgi:rRNA-processing protein FCF1
MVAQLVMCLLQRKEKLDISVLTHYVATAKALQKAIYQTVGYHKNLLVETVSRMQGLTTDVTIYVVPNTGYHRSLEKRLFNVATSRAKRHTLIIADQNILDNPHIDEEVRAYLQKLDDEFSFFIQSDAKAIACNCDEKPKEEVEEIESNVKAYVQLKTDTKADNKIGVKVVGKIDSNNEDEFQKDDTKQTNNQENEQSDSYKTEAESPNKIGVKVVGQIDLSKFEKPKKEIRKDKKNLYIIDTNVFVDYPEIISRIGKEYTVILSAKVLDELDKLKITLDNQGKLNVQKALKSINMNIDKRDVRMDTADLSLLPKDFNKKSPDNFILSVALKYKQENPILLTSDNGLQIKAKGFNIKTITLKEFLK